MKQKYPVIFVGAGPGDPELITVKGQKALAAADLIVYAGSLVPKALLQWTRPDARKIDSASLDLRQIITEIETACQNGERVVRLHTGDPSLYGAIYEQIAELRKRDISAEVIPGVTAAFAAAAAMKMEYTLPEISQTLILTRMAGRTPVPESESLEKLAEHQTSMAIYLSVGMVGKVSETLRKSYGKNAPCAVAYRVSHPDEKIVRTTLDRLDETVRAGGIAKQALIIVGKVLGETPDSLKHKSKLYDKDFGHGYRSLNIDNQSLTIEN